LHSNPTFAHYCGFLSRDVLKQPGEWTSRRLPSLSVCEEFSEVMTRYRLWQLARLDQVRDNLAAGVVEVEKTLVFDTTSGGPLALRQCGPGECPRRSGTTAQAPQGAPHAQALRLRPGGLGNLRAPVDSDRLGRGRGGQRQNAHLLGS
jgi:hypothetical protein